MLAVLHFGCFPYIDIMELAIDDSLRDIVLVIYSYLERFMYNYLKDHFSLQHTYLAWSGVDTGFWKVSVFVGGGIIIEPHGRGVPEAILNDRSPRASLPE